LFLRAVYDGQAHVADTKDFGGGKGGSWFFDGDLIVPV
jgi:hypothetical protein